MKVNMFFNTSFAIIVYIVTPDNDFKLTETSKLHRNICYILILTFSTKHC
jgi:hypothetical protein